MKISELILKGVLIMVLTTIYDARQSFYKKAQYIKIGKYLVLTSYGTKVCEIDTSKHTYTIWSGNCYEEFLTPTTLRHIREFLRQFFYKKEIPLPKKDILKNATIVL